MCAHRSERSRSSRLVPLDGDLVRPRPHARGVVPSLHPEQHVHVENGEQVAITRYGKSSLRSEKAVGDDLGSGGAWLLLGSHAA